MADNKRKAGIKNTFYRWIAGDGRKIEKDPRLSHDRRGREHTTRSSSFVSVEEVAPLQASTDLSRKQVTDMHKMNEIGNRSDNHYNSRHTHANSGDTSTRNINQRPNSGRISNSTKGAIKSQSVTQETHNNNHTTHSNVSGEQTLKLYEVYDNNQHQRNLHQGCKSNCNRRYPGKPERILETSQTEAQTRLKVSGVPTSDAKPVENSCQTKSIQFKDYQGILDELPPVIHNMRTVTEIESNMRNVGTTYSQQETGISEVLSRDQEKNKELDSVESQVCPMEWNVSPREEKNEDESKYNEGNHQICYTNQEALTYSQTDPLTEVGKEVTESFTTHREENANHTTQHLDTREDDDNERKFSAKMDDSEVAKRIDVIRANSEIFRKEIDNFNGNSSLYHFIDENLTRFLLKLDKLPVEHSHTLKLQRRAAIKCIYELQNKLEENLRNQLKMGRLAVSQI